jgi:hypothetical protein
MPEFLYKVDDVFDIGGRLTMATPGIPPKTPGIRNGVAIELRRPDGTIIETQIGSIAIVDPYDPKRPIQFSFPAGLTKQDVPVGTEVWLRDEKAVA